ncbi:hypothetical protein [Acinetobacter guillouiae]|uniref:hypothetical protein n=1 Tax=Acinetobacter guillouiae TaxID=106649 RepID=UPI003AF6A515
MKKILMTLLLSQSLFLIAPETMAQTKIPFSASKMAQVQVPELSFKEVMRTFYSGQMHRALLDDEDLGKMPHIALGQADKDGETTVALMHPVMSYQNNLQESRYLVIIEKIKVGSGGYVVSCHACTGTADLYSFKKLQNGQFQLVSRSAKGADFSGSWGRVGLDLDEISKNIQPLGRNLVGSIFQNGYTSTGTTETWWETLHLSENDYIQVFGVADAGSNNSGSYDEDSPLNYSYEGELQVINNGTDFFPIKVTYSGEKPSDDYEKINKINYSKTVNFDKFKNEYK